MGPHSHVCVSCGGQFNVGLAAPGEVNIDYVYLQPGEWGRVNGLGVLKSGVDNLHAIWDSVIYEATGYVNLPLTDKAWDEYTKAVEDIHEHHDIDKSLVKPGDYMAWAEESLQLSIDVVYNSKYPRTYI